MQQRPRQRQSKPVARCLRFRPSNLEEQKLFSRHRMQLQSDLKTEILNQTVMVSVEILSEAQTFA